MRLHGQEPDRSVAVIGHQDLCVARQLRDVGQSGEQLPDEEG
jgi:hypothetical protein